jgi:hypothetical protein
MKWFHAQKTLTILMLCSEKTFDRMAHAARGRLSWHIRRRPLLLRARIARFEALGQPCVELIDVVAFTFLSSC